VIDVGTDPLDVLAAECDLVSAVARELPEEDYLLPTRCPAWNVKELLAHMDRDVDRINAALEAPAPPVADTDSVSYWRAYDPSVDASAIAGRAKDLAASFGWGSELAAAWDELWRRAVAAAAQEDPARVVVTWGPALTLEDLVKTRVLEITVHGTDLSAALRRPAWATEGGLRITTGILTGLLGEEHPEALGWDDLTLLEKGTGRAQLTEDEGATLGPLAGRFPLLG